MASSNDTPRSITIVLPPRRTWIIVGVLIGIALGGAFVASAGDGNRNTSNVADGPLIVPYEGFLMLDSGPVTADAQAMTFRLFDAPQGGNELWVETQSVNIYNGRFSVGLGAVEPLTAIILDAEKVFLSITVDDVALSGRQAIEPVPYAAWAGHGNDFKIGGTATIDGDLNFQGERRKVTNVDEVNGNGSILFRNGPNTESAIALSTAGVVVNPTLATSIAGGFGSFTLRSNIDNNNAPRFVLNNNDIDVFGNLDLANNIDVDGSTTLDATRIDGTLDLNGSLDLDGGNVDVNGSTTLNGTRIDGTLDLNGTFDHDGNIDLNGEINVDDNHSLYLETDEDASNANDGGLVVGPTNASNVTIDGNEILARNNGGNGTLFIQAEGGTADFGGTIQAPKVLVEGTTRTVTNPNNGTFTFANVETSGASCGDSPVLGVQLFNSGGELRIRLTCGPN